LAAVWFLSSVLVTTSPAFAADSEGLGNLVKLPPAVTTRLDKAAADLKALREELGLQPEQKPGLKPNEVALEDLPSAVQGALRDTILDSNAIAVDEADMRGLEHYARCEYDQAAALFEESLAAEPAKEFPSYFLGCIAFEEGRYDQATAHFQAVYEENSACTTAYFLATLSGLCAKQAKPVGLLDIALLANMAEARVNKELIPPAPASSSKDDLEGWTVHGPMTMRCKSAAAPILVAYEVQTARASMVEKDPEKAAALALLVKGKDIRDALLARLAKAHPDDVALQNVAFMARYFIGAGVLRHKDDDQLRKDLAAAVRREPDNGALLLLQIVMKPPVEVQVKGQPRPDYRDVPLTEAEIGLLHRAAQAPEFNSYRTFQQGFRRTYGSDRVAGLAGLALGEPIEPGMHWYNTKNRTTATMNALAAEGKMDAVVRLYGDAVEVAGRIMDEAPDDIFGAMTGVSWRAASAEALYDCALRAGGKELMQLALRDHSREIGDREVRVVVGDAVAAWPYDEIPVQRFMLAVEEAESPWSAEGLYRRLLREKHPEYLKQALDDYGKHREWERKQAAAGSPLPPDAFQYEYAREAVLLGDLGDPKGVPALKEMAAGQGPLVAYMAKAALGKIEAGQEPGQMP